MPRCAVLDIAARQEKRKGIEANMETVSKIQTIMDDKNGQLAIIIRADHQGEGIEFVTGSECEQQLAYMSHPQGTDICPHVHKQVHREIDNTREILVIKKGCYRVDFYSEEKQYLKSCIVRTGDVILLLSNAHGFKALEDTELYEIKQGPFAEGMDKEKFDFHLQKVIYENEEETYS